MGYGLGQMTRGFDNSRLPAVWYCALVLCGELNNDGCVEPLASCIMKPESVINERLTMTDIVQRYKSVAYTLPTRQQSWFLYGAGMDNLGKDGQAVEHDVPAPSADELLVRCDATGLCFSDIKIITQGNEHVRLKGRDMANHPVIMGHEAIVTVVQVGENLRGQYAVGQRFVVQADIYINGQTVAYGYVLPGALTQFETMGWQVLNGDEGCYLIPVQEKTGYAEAALTEPWACVVHSYVLEYRHGVKPGGVCLMLGGEGAETLTLGATFAEHHPARIVAVNLPAALRAAAQCHGHVKWSNSHAHGQCGGIDALVQTHTGGAGFDDIIICGKVGAECLEKLASKLARAGVLNIVGDQPLDRPLAVDVGRIHYEDWQYVGNAGRDISASYAEQRHRTELKPGGSTWFLGAGGPMGQMHVQRACEMPNGPAYIVASDIDPERLAGAARALHSRRAGAWAHAGSAQPERLHAGRVRGEIARLLRRTRLRRCGGAGAGTGVDRTGGGTLRG